MVDQGTENKRQKAQGLLVVLVGASGSGKDTLLNYVRNHSGLGDDILFVRRTITRDAADPHEEYDTLTTAEFTKAAHEGKYCVVWEAHGLHYGVPASAQRHVDEGGLAILNGSRRALHCLADAFQNFKIIHITTTREALRERLHARNRETADQIEQRIEQMNIAVDPDYEAIEIDNSRTIEEAGEKLLSVIKALSASRQQAG